MFSSQGQVSSNIMTVLIPQAYKTISGRSVVTARKDGIVGEPLQSYNNFHLGAECRRLVFGFFLMFLGVCPSFTNIYKWNLHGGKTTMLYLNLSGHDIFKTRFGTSPEKHCLTAMPYRLFQGNLRNLHKIGT